MRCCRAQYGEPNIRRAVPLGLGLLNISNPRVTVMDTLSKLTHDADAETAQCAIFALGLIGAGSAPNQALKARGALPPVTAAQLARE